MGGRDEALASLMAAALIGSPRVESRCLDGLTTEVAGHVPGIRRTVKANGRWFHIKGWLFLAFPDLDVHGGSREKILEP